MLSFLGVVAVVTLALTAFGSGSPTPASATPIPGMAFATGAPRPVVLATVSNLQLQLPVAEGNLTALGYHGITNGALTLQPTGRQANQGILARIWQGIAGTEKTGPDWFQLGGGGGVGTQVLDVGAPAGTDVYAPVDGTIASIRDFVVNDRVVGARVDIRPTAAPAVIVSLTHLAADPSLAVGSPVLAHTSKLGRVTNLARFERQALSEHTGDAGNNVAIEVHPAASALP